MTTRRRKAALRGLVGVLLASGSLAPVTIASAEGGKHERTRRCVHLAWIRETRVVDDRTVLFVLRGKTVLENRLPFPCPGLDVARAFSYATSIGQLCNTDLIRVAGPARSVCRLGRFRVRSPPPSGATAPLEPG